MLLGRHRGPRVAFSRDAIVISAPAKTSAAAKTELRAWRSTDRGKTWTETAMINDLPGAAEEGLHAMAADAAGNLFAAWLDHRHADKGKELYGARSTDGGLTWSKNTLIYTSPDSTICQCCHPSATFDASGQLLIMWRNALGGNRDMYLARSRDGVAFSKAEKLGQDSWRLEACPMDGGGVAVSGDRIVTAWRRDKEIFVARPGEKEVGVGEGVDVSIAAVSGGVYVAWSSARGIEALAPGEKTPSAIAPAGKFPNVAAVAGHALLAYEADGKIFVDRR